MREDKFPATIVRPSLTYGDLVIPLVLNCWRKSYTLVDRMRKGRPVIIPGDGLSLWTITHNSDFAVGLLGLLGKEAALGQAFHITSDEALTWDQIFKMTADAAGVKAPNFVHIASDFIIACAPAFQGTLLGDKSNSALFDNTKIRRVVPEFETRTRFRQGIAQTLASFNADPARQAIDVATNQEQDRILAAYQRGLDAIR
jgi:nucleoside-diphosphate-sugar epimerase